jgi:hypothetical protein
VDVSGYLRGGDPSMAGAFGAVTPTRIADSRVPLQLSGALPGRGTAQLQINGRGDVPATGVAAVVLNVTAVSPTDAGYLTVWPSGIARTTTSNLNFQAAQTIANTVVVPVGCLDSAGKISIFNGSAGTVQVVVDVSGYILFGAPSPRDRRTAAHPGGPWAAPRSPPAAAPRTRWGSELAGGEPAIGQGRRPSFIRGG